MIQRQYKPGPAPGSCDICMTGTDPDPLPAAAPVVLDIAEEPDTEIEDYLYDYYYRKVIYSRESSTAEGIQAH